MIQGLLLLNKPKGMTSFSAVARIKRLSGEKRVGHTGTLDPMATGVLPVLIGRATALSSYLLDADKRYVATVLFGKVTDTGDVTGETLQTNDVNITDTDIDRAIEHFMGEITQVPPMYSAVKINGVPCYKLARKGKEVERKARHVAVLDYEITRIDLEAAEVDFRVHCTKGFYVRTYAHDIGQRLGCGAHLTALRRIRSGHFDIAEAVDVPTLKAASRDELLARLLPVEKVLADRA